MRAFIGRLAHPEPGFDINHVAPSSHTDKAFFVPPTKVSFGPICLLPTQFLLLEGDEPVSTFFASDERGGGLGIASVCAVVAVAAALDSILTTSRWPRPACSPPRARRAMNDRLSALKLFARAARVGNFSSAGRELGLSQPSASRLIAALEARRSSAAPRERWR